MTTENAPIVVGVDGTPASDQALRWATHEATLRNCPPASDET
ncbi:universal stress protein [Lentzea sp. BCCO 10_0798]|jgi:nucleotide-binding universal stress UspA family protein|uniref:Universal stress protein n=1 Tax=Lentzea kristufekii TaxID=3095430 RepID=A0ABU4TW85_9PSEU|nr:universal stress protein [Lentzea sp. BCCO 10_0798]MDX8052152.1 universal stress protein [Lentzea sp. BCCO 10_0798]